MLELNEALDLIASGEGQRVEFKTSFAEEHGGIESLGAFSNAEGGTVLFGVRPSGDVCGTSIGSNTLENFANRLRRETEPPLFPQVETLVIEDETVVAVRVASARPGQLVHVFSQARIRVGRTNQIMSSEEQKARLLSDQPGGQEEEPALIKGASADDGRAGFIWVENPGLVEKFSVRLRGFHAGNLGMELRATWRTGEEERTLKRGDKDWCRVLALEAGQVPTVLSRDGELRIPFGRADDLKRQNERRRRGVRLVRFLGEPQSVDIEVAQGELYVMDVVVLSDTRAPTRVQVSYGVGGDRIVLPFDESVIRPLVEKDLELRRKIEEMFKGVALKDDHESELTE